MATIDKKKIYSHTEIEQMLVDLDIDVIEADRTVIKFWYKDNIITYWIKKQWLTGRGVSDGRGLQRMLNQFKK